MNLNKQKRNADERYSKQIHVFIAVRFLIICTRSLVLSVLFLRLGMTFFVADDFVYFVGPLYKSLTLDPNTSAD